MKYIVTLSAKYRNCMMATIFLCYIYPGTRVVACYPNGPTKKGFIQKGIIYIRIYNAAWRMRLRHQGPEVESMVTQGYSRRLVVWWGHGLLSMGQIYSKHDILIPFWRVIPLSWDGLGSMQLLTSISIKWCSLPPGNKLHAPNVECAKHNLNQITIRTVSEHNIPSFLRTFARQWWQILAKY